MFTLAAALRSSSHSFNLGMRWEGKKQSTDLECLITLLINLCQHRSRDSLMLTQHC